MRLTSFGCCLGLMAPGCFHRCMRIMNCYSPKSKHMAGNLELCHLLWKLHLGTSVSVLVASFGIQARPAVCHWIVLDLDPQPTSTAVSSSPLANLCSFL